MSSATTRDTTKHHVADTDISMTVALLGNPNTGKSTLFSAIAGIPTRIGNYPGVTVEEKVGQLQHHGKIIELIDLPGTYSLNAKSPDEEVAVDVLHGRIESIEQPDCIVVVVDATNLSRNLFLVSQALAIGRPVFVALTLCDVAESKGIQIDREKTFTDSWMSCHSPCRPSS